MSAVAAFNIGLHWDDRELPGARMLHPVPEIDKRLEESLRPSQCSANIAEMPIAYVLRAMLFLLSRSDPPDLRNSLSILKRVNVPSSTNAADFGVGY